MTTYVALIRGINVGGHKLVVMADLRDFLTQLGLLSHAPSSRAAISFFGVTPEPVRNWNARSKRRPGSASLCKRIFSSAPRENGKRSSQTILSLMKPVR